MNDTTSRFSPWGFENPDYTEIYYIHADKKTLLDIGADESTIHEDISQISELMDHKDVDKLTQVELTEKQCAELIPNGAYCYTTFEDPNKPSKKLKGCPFWDRILDFPKQNNGYCHYMKIGDWQLNGGLLWDQCKHCGINDEDENYE